LRTLYNIAAKMLAARRVDDPMPYVPVRADDFHAMMDAIAALPHDTPTP